jgi:hypothetical protein
MVGGGIFAASGLAVELTVPLRIWFSQDRLPRMLTAGVETVTLGPGRSSFTHRQIAWN